MWIRITNNAASPAVIVELKEDFVSGCEYRIMGSGKPIISMNKSGYNSTDSLETKIRPLMNISDLDVDLLSGDAVLKSFKANIQNYTLSGAGSSLYERLELFAHDDVTQPQNAPVVVVQPAQAAPLISSSIYNSKTGIFSILSGHLNHDADDFFHVDVTKVNAFGVQLSGNSTTVAVDHPRWDIKLSATDKKAIDNAITAGSKTELKVTAGWDGPDSTDLTVAEITIELT